MSTPSMHRQATRAHERATEGMKAQLDTLEAKSRADYEELTDRMRRADMEIQALRDSNARLTKDNEENRARIKELEFFRANFETKFQLLQAQVNYESGRLDVAVADVETLAPGLTIKTFDEGPLDLAPHGPPLEPVVAGPVALDADGQSRAAALQSREAYNNTKIKNAARSLLFGLYQVSNFNNIADKHYPHIPTDHEEWPHEIKPDGSRVNHMRLDFEQDFDSPRNQPEVRRWVQAIRDQGEIRVAGVQPYLNVISDKDLLARVKETFKWEQRTYREAMKGTPIPTKNRTETGNLVPAPVVEPNPAPLTEKDLEVKQAKLAVMPTSTRQSHQETKRDTRTRKRALLAGDNKKYSDPKYHSVLSLGAQSEDDYEVESVNGHEPRKTGKLVAREWHFASEELISCKAAIDAVADPRPKTGKAPTPIVRGPTRPGSPRSNKKPDNKLRRWMIRADVLEKHPEWLASGRVLEDDGSLASTAITASSTKRKSADESGVPNEAGPSTKGKQARLTLRDREKALKIELGELKYSDHLTDIS